jgi:hypothetical protein
LENRSSHWVVTRHFGEVKRDDELTERDHRPGPDEDAAQGHQSEGKEREDTGRRRDVTKGRGEGTEEPERAVQFLFVTERL